MLPVPARSSPSVLRTSTFLAQRERLIGPIAAALVALTAAGAATLTWTTLPLDPAARTVLFMTTICLASALWLLAVALVRRDSPPPRAIWIVLAAAIAMRAITFATPPLLSSDIYRYVWDGRVQGAGINPYRYLPAAPELAFLRDEAVYPHINRADYAPTIYPPAAEALFAAAAVVAPGVYGMKAVMTAFDVLTIASLAALLRLAGRNPAELLIYAWLPLPVWEFAGNGHIDAAAAGLLAVTLLLAARNRQAGAGLALAAATLTKFLPGVVLPAFWRPGNWRLPAAFAAISVALYLPYLTAGRHVFGFLGGYATEEGLGNGYGIFLLEAVARVFPLPTWTPVVYAVAVLAVLAALGIRFAFAHTSRLRTVESLATQAAILGAVLLVAISPHYPWYFGWLAPLACLAPFASVLWLLAAAPILAHGSVEYPVVPAAVYVPAAILALYDLHKSRATPKSIITPTARNT